MSIIAEVFSEGFAPQVVMVVDAVANQIVSLGTLGVGDTVITSLQSLSGGLAVCSKYSKSYSPLISNPWTELH